MSDAVTLANELRGLRRRLERLEAQEAGGATAATGLVRMRCVAPGLVIPGGYALVAPEYLIESGAELTVANGAELTLVG
jgi:hypothetical protein